MFTGNGEKNISNKEKIAEANVICSPSSTYSGFPTQNKDYTQQCNQAMAFCGVPIMAHRPHNGPHVGLYYEGFGRFMSKCDTITPTWDDCLVAKRLCSVMAEYYENESARVAAFKTVLEDYIGLRCSLEFAIKSGKCDLVMSSFLLLLLEGKVEIGQGNSDSLSEIIGYFIGSMCDRKPESCPSPAFLLELVGAHLFISGAVYGEGVYVDRLTHGLWLTPQHQSPQFEKYIARVLRALKEEMIALEAYYKNDQAVVFPRFPAFQQFDNKQINYKKQITPTLFEASVGGGGSVNKICTYLLY